MAHPLHCAIGKALDAALPACKLIKDPACGGKHNIPLFLHPPKAAYTELCDVDLLVLQNGCIRVILEIEEANIKPTQVCGKLLTSALASFHQYKTGPILQMDKATFFVQVVDSSKLPPGAAKLCQLAEIEHSIDGVLPLKGSAITEYHLFLVCGPNDKDGIQKVVACVEDAISK